MKKITFCFLIVMFLIASCGGGIETVQSTPSLPPATQASPQPERTLLTADALINGFAFDGPVDESALTPPEDASPARHIFEGRLELLGEKENNHIKVLRGELPPEYTYLPEFDFEFVQDNGYLIPVRRGNYIADHPTWNIILEPGRVWQETGDTGLSRASLPFALTVKGGNATFNGTLTFLFDDQAGCNARVGICIRRRPRGAFTGDRFNRRRSDLWGIVLSFSFATWMRSLIVHDAHPAPHGVLQTIP